MRGAKYASSRGLLLGQRSLDGSKLPWLAGRQRQAIDEIWLRVQRLPRLLDDVGEGQIPRVDQPFAKEWAKVCFRAVDLVGRGVQERREEAGACTTAQKTKKALAYTAWCDRPST